MNDPLTPLTFSETDRAWLRFARIKVDEPENEPPGIAVDKPEPTPAFDDDDDGEQTDVS